jgi:hypothetical protein
MLDINRGGHFLLTDVVTKTASQNLLKCPPWLILINRGGYPNATTSVNTLTEVGTL